MLEHPVAPACLQHHAEELVRGTVPAVQAPAIEGKLHAALPVLGYGKRSPVDHAQNQCGGKGVAAVFVPEPVESPGGRLQVPSKGNLAAPYHFRWLDAKNLLPCGVPVPYSGSDHCGHAEHEQAQELAEPGSGRTVVGPAEIRAFHGGGQYIAEAPVLYAGAVEHALIETQQDYHRAVPDKRFRALEHHLPVEEIHPAPVAETPGAGIGRIQTVLKCAHRDLHVLRFGAQARRDGLQVQHVVVAEGLYAARHGIAYVEDVVPQAAYAPAYFRPVVLRHDAAAPGFLGNAPVRVPFALVDIAAPALVADFEPADSDVSEIPAHQIPLRA